MRTYQEWQNEHREKTVLLRRCAEAVRSIAPNAEVILYGSVARGEETSDSDVDLLVLVPQEVTPRLRRAINDAVYEVELESDQIVTTIIRKKEEWQSPPLNITSLYHAIEQEGVRI